MKAEMPRFSVHYRMTHGGRVVSVTANSCDDAAIAGAMLGKVDAVILQEPKRKVAGTGQGRLPFHQGANR